MQHTLNIAMSEKTRRKLGALAVLTGKSYSELERRLSEYFDYLITKEIEEALGFAASNETAPSPFSGGAAAQPASVAEPEVTEDHMTGHNLSEDEDEGAESLEEAFARASREEEEPPPAQSPKKKTSPRGAAKTTKAPAKAKKTEDDEFHFPTTGIEDVGEDVESFLDASLGEPDTIDEHDLSGRGRVREAGKRFNPSKRQARVSAYNPDEDASDFDGGRF